MKWQTSNVIEWFTCQREVYDIKQLESIYSVTHHYYKICQSKPSYVASNKCTFACNILFIENIKTHKHVHVLIVVDNAE